MSTLNNLCVCISTGCTINVVPQTILNNVCLSGVSYADFYTYTGDTATCFDTKVNCTNFNTYTGDTATCLDTKVNCANHNWLCLSDTPSSYIANCQLQVNSGGTGIVFTTISGGTGTGNTYISTIDISGATTINNTYHDKIIQASGTGYTLTIATGVTDGFFTTVVNYLDCGILCFVSDANILSRDNATTMVDKYGAATIYEDDNNYVLIGDIQ